MTNQQKDSGGQACDMTLHQYYMGLALTGLMGQGRKGKLTPADGAMICSAVADAMIAAGKGGTDD